jgi:hypothetical protein
VIARVESPGRWAAGYVAKRKPDSTTTDNTNAYPLDGWTFRDNGYSRTTWVVTRGRNYFDLVRKYHFMLKKRFGEYNESDSVFIAPQDVADRV